MVPEDEQQERLEHRQRFLSDRGLVSREVESWSRQLWLLERLAGKDPARLDPQLRERIQGEIERCTMEQLKATGLVDDWLAAWETRHETPTPAPPPDDPAPGPSVSNRPLGHVSR